VRDTEARASGEQQSTYRSLYVRLQQARGRGVSWPAPCTRAKCDSRGRRIIDASMAGAMRAARAIVLLHQRAGGLLMRIVHEAVSRGPYNRKLCETAPPPGGSVRFNWRTIGGRRIMKERGGRHGAGPERRHGSAGRVNCLKGVLGDILLTTRDWKRKKVEVRHEWLAKRAVLTTVGAACRSSLSGGASPKARIYVLRGENGETFVALPSLWTSRQRGIEIIA